MRTLVVALLHLLLTTGCAAAEIIFSDNFDTSPQWTSRQSVRDLTWPETGAVDDGGRCTGYCPPPGWTYYGGAKTVWKDRNHRRDTYMLGPAGARGNSGKGMTVWHEGAGQWADGNMLSKYLGAGYQELYVRFYLKYDAGWSWSDGSAKHGQQKIMRIASYGNGKNRIDREDPLDHYGSRGWNVPVWMPYFYHNGSYKKTRFVSGARLAPRYTVIPRYEDAHLKSEWPADGNWHCYEYYVKLNSSPGKADGRWRLFIDGISREGRDDMLWVQSVAWQPRTPYAPGLSHVITPTKAMRGYRVLQGGVSGDAEPQWDSLCPGIGDVCKDGTVLWQNYTNYNWNHLTFLDNTYTTHEPGRHHEQSMSLDNVVISTHYSGPPPPPTALAVRKRDATTVRLSWEAGDNGATYLLSGYHIYYGSEPGKLTSRVRVGKVTECVVTGLAPGTRYLFAVAAFNENGFEPEINESLFSDIVKTKTLPPDEKQ